MRNFKFCALKWLKANGWEWMNTKLYKSLRRYYSLVVKNLIFAAHDVCNNEYIKHVCVQNYSDVIATLLVTDICTRMQRFDLYITLLI